MSDDVASKLRIVSEFYRDAPNMSDNVLSVWTTIDGEPHNTVVTGDDLLAVADLLDKPWKPSWWFRVVLEADGSVWCESSVPDEAIEALGSAPSPSRLERLWTLSVYQEEWRPESSSNWDIEE